MYWPNSSLLCTAPTLSLPPIAPRLWPPHGPKRPDPTGLRPLTLSFCQGSGANAVWLCLPNYSEHRPRPRLSPQLPRSGPTLTMSRSELPKGGRGSDPVHRGRGRGPRFLPAPPPSLKSVTATCRLHNHRLCNVVLMLGALPEWPGKARRTPYRGGPKPRAHTLPLHERRRRRASYNFRGRRV